MTTAPSPAARIPAGAAPVGSGPVGSGPVGAAPVGAGPAGPGTPAAALAGSLRAAVGSLPRMPLAVLPTPLVPAPRLAEALGARSLLVKRDDLTGFAFGGNKARLLEFLVAGALAVASQDPAAEGTS